MKALKVILGGIALLLIAAIVLQTAASESGEVVVLAYTDPAGKVHETRLWVVEHQGLSWIRSGQESSGWATRIGEAAEVTITRDGHSEDYRAVAAPEMKTTINDLMLSKYGWRERVISAMFGAREGSLPLRLEVMRDPDAHDDDH